jgi:hypothetical protein
VGLSPSGFLFLKLFGVGFCLIFLFFWALSWPGVSESGLYLGCLDFKGAYRLLGNNFGSKLLYILAKIANLTFDLNLNNNQWSEISLPRAKALFLEFGFVELRKISF